ncbi:MAG: PhzF family phenazine biosynthesis protein [Candidatus Thorarchaeota archaeon]|nr:MAG: PhzF family phenazine biosynthesis protein [Candidatus Thorarchaeota archaeon]
MQTSVFTDKRYAFSGNQLATFWDYYTNKDLSQEEMQGIAREMNFSETTFAFPTEIEGCDSKVRIFTPGAEIPFAGHPTLGSAYVLKLKGIIQSEKKEAALELGIGLTPVEFLEENLIRMTQRAPEFLDEFGDKAALAEMVGIDEIDISEEFPTRFVSTGHPFLIVPLKTLSAVKKASPNGQMILDTLENEVSQNAVILCTQTVHEDSHAHVRMFAPDVGVLEDPATGSAAGPIGAYLEHHEVLSGHQYGERMSIEQGHEMMRPSLLHVQTVGKDDIKSVLVSGTVRLVAEGEFYLP